MEKGKYVIGIDAGGTKVAYGLFDRDGVIVDKMQHPADPDADGPAFADQMIRSVQTLRERNHLTPDDIAGIGVGMPSYIIHDKGLIYLTSALPKVRDFYMRDYMQERLGVPIVLENDSNGAALAEHRRGAGRGTEHMVYVSASTGLGSGLIINGKIFRGSYGFAGETGHMLMTPDEGIMCGCRNRGCFMSYGSGKYIVEHIKNRLDEGAQSELAKVDRDSLSAVDLLAACRKGDTFALEMLDKMAHAFAVCIYNIYEMLNINVYVFGGGLTNFGDLLFSRIRREFDRYNHIDLPVEFRFAELKEDFGIIGAAEAFLEEYPAVGVE